jgi:hypothetical protein
MMVIKKKWRKCGRKHAKEKYRVSFHPKLTQRYRDELIHRVVANLCTFRFFLNNTRHNLFGNSRIWNLCRRFSSSQYRGKHIPLVRCSYFCLQEIFRFCNYYCWKFPHETLYERLGFVELCVPTRYIRFTNGTTRVANAKRTRVANAKRTRVAAFVPFDAVWDREKCNDMLLSTLFIAAKSVKCYPMVQTLKQEYIRRAGGNCAIVCCCLPNLLNPVVYPDLLK